MFLGCINNHRSHCVGKFELNVLQEKVLSWNEDNCRRLPAFKILGFNCDVIGGSRRQVIEFKGSIVTGNGGPAVSGIIPFEYDGRARDDIPVNIGHCAADVRCQRIGHGMGLPGVGKWPFHHNGNAIALSVSGLLTGRLGGESYRLRLWCIEWTFSSNYRRGCPAFLSTPEGELVPVQIPATRESFVARDERIAMDACETTIKHDPAYSEYAPRLPELNWQECEVSDDEWNARCARFVAVKHP